MTYNVFSGTLNLTQPQPLTVLWIGFCLTGYISLCLDSYVFMFVFLCYLVILHMCCIIVTRWGGPDGIEA